jgi:hypothetical protein
MFRTCGGGQDDATWAASQDTPLDICRTKIDWHALLQVVSFLQPSSIGHSSEDSDASDSEGEAVASAVVGDPAGWPSPVPEDCVPVRPVGTPELALIVVTKREAHPLPSPRIPRVMLSLAHPQPADLDSLRVQSAPPDDHGDSEEEGNEDYENEDPSQQ